MDNKPDSTRISKDEIIQRRILDSAKTLFIKHGVENVNMHQIAKMAGVGQASLYRRYKEKGHICLDIVNEECQPFFDEVNLYLSQAAEAPALDKLYQIIIKFITFLEAHDSWLCAVSRATVGYRPLHAPLYQWMRNVGRKLLNDAVQQKEAENVDVVYTIEALLSALHNIDFHIQDHGFTKEQVLAGIHRIFIEGLKRMDTTKR